MEVLYSMNKTISDQIRKEVTTTGIHTGIDGSHQVVLYEYKPTTTQEEFHDPPTESKT